MYTSPVVGPAGALVCGMARSAGGDWQDPDEAMLSAIREEEAKRIEEMKAKAAQG
jgi:hypothetical protein